MIDTTRLKELRQNEKFKGSDLDTELEHIPDQISESEFMTLLPVWLRIARRSK